MTETEQTPSDTPITDAKAFDSDTGNEVVRADDCRAIERAANAMAAILDRKRIMAYHNAVTEYQTDASSRGNEAFKKARAFEDEAAAALAAFTSLRTKGAQS